MWTCKQGESAIFYSFITGFSLVLGTKQVLYIMQMNSGICEFPPVNHKHQYFAARPYTHLGSGFVHER